MISMCARVRFFALIIRRSQNTRFLCRTRVRFFALMIHKSVTCAMVPNKPGVPLTEKTSTRVHFFGDGICQLSFFSHTSILRASSALCFPRPSFKFHTKIFVRRAISEFIPPTTSPSPQYPPPSLLPLPASQTAAAAPTASTTSTFCSDPVR